LPSINTATPIPATSSIRIEAALKINRLRIAWRNDGLARVSR
jgi:hypothetical protein